MVLFTKKCFSQSHLARMVYDISYQVRCKSRVKLSKRIALTLSLHRYRRSTCLLAPITYKSYFIYLRYVASSTNDMVGINCLYLEKPNSTLDNYDSWKKFIKRGTPHLTSRFCKDELGPDLNTVSEPTNQATHHLYTHTKPNNVEREGMYWEKPKSHIG